MRPSDFRKPPLTPIFDPAISRGAIVPGGTPGSPQLVIVSTETITLPVSVLDPQIPSCPTSLTIAGTLQDLTNLGSAGFGVAYTNGFALVTGDSSQNVTSIDVSNPASPTFSDIISVGVGATPRGIDMYGTYAVVCDGNSVMTIIDASDPTNLSTTGTLSDAQLGSGYDVKVVGDLAYVATLNADRVTIVDISTPATPTIIGSVQNAAIIDSVRGIDVVGDYCYVSAFSDNRFVVLDVSDPTTPTIVGNVVDATNLNGVWAIAAMGGDLVAAGAFTGDRFTIVDVSTPTAPTVVGSVTDTLLNGIRDIVVSPLGCVYCVSSIGDSILLMDVSNPTTPTILDSITAGASNLDEATGLAISGDSTLYVGAIASSRLTVVQGS